MEPKNGNPTVSTVLKFLINRMYLRFCTSRRYFKHINEINTTLQGKSLVAHELYSIVKAFKVKLKLFSRQLSQNNTVHFTTLATMAQPMMSTEKIKLNENDICIE